MKRLLLSLFMLFTIWGAHAQDFTMEPRIFSDTVRVTVSGLQTDTVTILVFDAQGKTVLTPLWNTVIPDATELTLHTDTLLPGLYIFQCRINGVTTHVLRGDKRAYTSVHPVVTSSNQEVSVYPNPCGEVLHVKFDTRWRETSYTIFNLTGKQVGEGPLQPVLPTDYLPTGCYFLHVYEVDERRQVIPFFKK